MVVIDKLHGVRHGLGVLGIDDPQIKVPELYVASSVLKGQWENSGKTLPVLAADINAMFDDMAGLNKDNLSRLLNAGTRKGILTINTALPGLWFIAKYFGISPDDLLIKMGAERLRRYIYAALDRVEKSPSNFLDEFVRIGVKGPQLQTIKDWFAGAIVYGDLYNQSADIATVCNNLGLFKDRMNGRSVRDIIHSITE